MKRLGLIFSLATVVFLVFPHLTLANDYYVSTTGSDSNPGTKLAMWKTIQKAANSAVAGDSVFVRGGIYSESVSPKSSGVELKQMADVDLGQGNKAVFGTAFSGVKIGDYLFVYNSWKSNNGAYKINQVGTNYVLVEGTPFVSEATNVKASIATPVIYRNYPGESVTIDAARLGDALDFGSWSSTQGYDYNIFDGINITRSSSAGVNFLYSSHNVIRNAKVYQNDAPGFYLINNSQYNIIENNDISANGYSQPGEGIYIGIANGSDTSYGTQVIHNYIHDMTTGDEGTDIKPNIINTVVEGNVYENIKGTWGIMLLNSGVAGSVIYNNILHDNSGNSQYVGAITISGGLNNSVFNNLIYNNAGIDGIYINKYPGNKIYHNTIFGNDVGIGIGSGGTDFIGTEIINNLLSNNGNQIDSAPTGVTINNNLFHGSSSVLGNNPLKLDPVFINPNNSDFHLKSVSPAIDSGLGVGISGDLDLASRPQGSGYDIGVYEFLEPSAQELKTILGGYLKTATVLLDQYPDSKINVLDFVAVLKRLP